MKDGNRKKSEPLETLEGVHQNGSQSALPPGRKGIRPLRIIIALDISIFVVEVVVMLFFSVLPPFSVPVEAFFGGVLVSVLVLPSLYVMLIRPLMVNIAERTQTEQRLQKTEERYKMLFEGVLDAIFVVDTETGLILDFNPAGAELIDRDKSELIGESHTIIHPPNEREGKFSRTFRQHLEEKRGQTLEAQVITKSGEIKEVAIKATLLEIEGKKVMLSVYRDITEQKHTQEAIESLSKFPSENPNPVLRVQRDGTILYSNEAALPFLAKWEMESDGVISDTWRHMIDGLSESATTRYKEEEVDGRIFSFVIAPILDGGYVNLYGCDITERQQKENELRKLNADLALASSRAGMAEVATDILHNVGNVLNSINVSANFIEEKVLNSRAANLKEVIDLLAEHTGDLGTFLTKDERGRHIPLYLKEVTKFILSEQKAIIERLRLLTKGVDHVKQIIKAQQNYARSGGIEVFMSIQEVIEDAVEIHHTALERYGIDLKFELAGLPKIRMDKQRVLQILVNLIANAKQALSESWEQTKVLTIRTYKHNENKLRIEVVDNGIGISKENIPKIFTHGFTTKKSGHGFGLHGSSLAAREMGGSLTVHSDGPGQGATFTLELPSRTKQAL